MNKPGIYTLQRKDWQVIASMLAACTLVVFAHFFAINAVNEYEASSIVVKDTYEAADLLRNLDHHLVEVESSVRSFVILEDEKYAVTTEKNIKKVKEDIIAVRSFFEDSSREELLVQLEELVDEKIRLNKNIMGSYRTDGKIAAAQMFSGSNVIQLQESISALTDSLRQHHRQYLDNYIGQKTATSNRLRTLSWLSVLTVFLLTAFSIFYLVKTARKRYEAEQEKEHKHQELLKALEAAKYSSLLKEQFVANVSHEIRTPLNAILGFSNLLQRTELKENQKEFAHNIQTSSENLLSIINDILDFSKIEAGALRIERIPFSLPSLLHSVDNMFRYRAEEKRLQFDVQADENLPEGLLGDPTRLTQILVNLLSNAFKFTSDGIVKLHAGTASRENGNIIVRFTVQDTGVGIPPDKQELIFERFGQASADTTRRYGGAGLGLTISKQLIELQGGTIRVESSEGKGTTFIMELPYAVAGVMTVNGTGKTQPGTFKNQQVDILIVEDNPMNRRIAELLLDNWGFRYEHAENGKAAIDLLRKRAYDLILMDIQMPEMDGYTAARIIRQELRLEVPIIATTAHAFAGEREKCISYGMNDYVSKPIKEEELLSLIFRYAPKGRKKKEPQDPPKTKGSNTESFDRQYVLDISKGKPEVLQEMTSLFISQSEKELAQIEAALQSSHFGDLATAAHSMKSTAGYMGFAASLGDLLKKLELEARGTSPDVATLRTVFEEVKNRRDEAVLFLENELQNG